MGTHHPTWPRKSRTIWRPGNHQSQNSMAATDLVEFMSQDLSKLQTMLDEIRTVIPILTPVS